MKIHRHREIAMPDKDYPVNIDSQVHKRLYKLIVDRPKLHSRGIVKYMTWISLDLTWFDRNLNLVNLPTELPFASHQYVVIRFRR